MRMLLIFLFYKEKKWRQRDITLPAQDCTASQIMHPGLLAAEPIPLPVFFFALSKDNLWETNVVLQTVCDIMGSFSPLFPTGMKTCLNSHPSV